MTRTRTWTTVGAGLVAERDRDHVDAILDRLDFQAGAAAAIAPKLGALDEWGKARDGATLAADIDNTPTGYARSVEVLRLGRCIRALRIPNVTAVATSSALAPHALYGIEGRYSNGVARVYVIATGSRLVPIASDFLGWAESSVAPPASQPPARVPR